MYCFIRHVLASLHFNENVHRECQTSKDGTPYMKVTYPKFKLGDEVVREVTVPPTYGEYDVKYLFLEQCFLERYLGTTHQRFSTCCDTC